MIWGLPVKVTMDEIKANLKGKRLKDARRLHVLREGVRKVSKSVLLEFEEDIPKKISKKARVHYLQCAGIFIYSQ